MIAQTHTTANYRAWGMFFCAVLSLLFFHGVARTELIFEQLDSAAHTAGISALPSIYEAAYASDSDYLLTPSIQCKNSHHRKGKCLVKALPLKIAAASAYMRGLCPVLIPARQYCDGGYPPIPGWKSAALFPLPPPSAV
jgi:hypothetical protein